MVLSGKYEIVTISTDKNTFLNDLDYKADIGQHFHRGEKSARRCHHHKIIKTNLKTLASPLLTRPQVSQGCQKMRTKIVPKLKNIQKSLGKQLVFLTFFLQFWWLLKFLSFLAQKENSFICKRRVIFWHPWDPWGRVNSGKKNFWVQKATVSALLLFFSSHIFSSITTGY